MFDDRGTPDRQEDTVAGRARPAGLEPLEPRLLLSAVYPTVYEQYLAELINRARDDPAAEAARFGIALNEGISSGLITTDAKQPVAINPYVTDAARGHSQWMLDNDVLSHTGAGGSSPGDRMVAAGYGTAGTFGWGENIAYSQSLVPPDMTTKTADMHELLFVDAGYAGRGHRKTICDPDYRETGTGVLLGEFLGNNFTMMVTEDFAYKFTNHFLTGVAYDESLVTGDEADGTFYHPGEELAGVTVTATRDSDGAVYTTTTWASGGYSLQVPAGTYTVTGSGGGLGGTVTYTSVVIGGQNVKRDFNPAPAEVQLVRPAGVEQVQRGDTYNVYWSGGQTGTTLDLWRLGTIGWLRTASNVPVGNGSDAWNTTGAQYGWYTFLAQVNYGGTWEENPPTSPGWLVVSATGAPAQASPTLGQGVLSAGGTIAEAGGPFPQAPAEPAGTPPSAEPAPAERLQPLHVEYPLGVPGVHEADSSAPAAPRHDPGPRQEAASDWNAPVGDSLDLLLSPMVAETAVVLLDLD